MNFEGILHLVYWNNPLYRIEISDKEMLGENEEEFVVEVNFYHEHFQRQIHFRFSLASGNMYYQDSNGNWVRQEPDCMKVKQLIDCEDKFYFACEGLITMDQTPHLVNLDREQHFLRIDNQYLNVILYKKDGLEERIKDLNIRFWNLEVEEMN